MSKTQIVGEWTPWSGGICPVFVDHRVHVSFRSGVETSGLAGRFEWGHNGTMGDILAYAVHKPYVKPAWRAELRHEFFYVATKGRAMRWTEKGDDFCQQVYEAGNYYPTEELATAAAQRVLNAYKGGTP